MAKTPIIEIPIDDSAFQRFLELFADFSAKVDDMPAAWQAINASMGEAGKSLEDGALSSKEALALAAAQAGVIAEELIRAVKAQHEFDRSTGTSNKSMSTLAKTVKGLGHDIFGIATNILKMGAVGIGLGAFGGFLGMDALAGASLSQRRAADSLGISPGLLSSFKVNAQQFLGVDALQSAADAQSDITKAGLLGQLGIDFNAARNESPAALAFEELRKAAIAWQSAPKGMEQQMPAVRAYRALGGSFESVRNAAQPGNLARLNAAEHATYADAAALNRSRASDDAMIRLKKQLDEAGLAIENDLIKTLARLAPVLTDLSKDLVGLAGTVLSSKDVQDAIKGGAQELADFLTKTDWNAVGNDIKDLGGKIKWALQLLHLIPGDDNTPTLDKLGPGGKTFGAIVDQGNDALGRLASGDDAKAAAAWISAHDKGHFGLLGNGLAWLGTQAQIKARALLGDYDPQRIHALNVMSSNQHKVPIDILDRLAMDESGYGKNLISSAGALGPYQFMPDTAKGYGINPLDTRQASDAAGKMMASLFKEFGSWDKAVAAYNWGAANLEADIKKHGADWLKYAPKETQGEVSNVAGGNIGTYDSAIAKALGKHAKAITRSGAGKPVKVSVTNSTAARVAVSINAAATA